MMDGQNIGVDSPTLIHVPHASVYIPAEYLADYRAEAIERELRLMTDWYCDELFDLGRETLRFPVSRLVCDVERFRDDGAETMAAVGMGWYYTRTSAGTELRRDSAERRSEILRRYYDAHHALFESAVRSRLRAFGRCLIVDGHSFFPEPLPHEPDQSTERPDFCIGTDAFHTPARLTAVCAAFLREKGYSVKINAPFSGAIVPMAYYTKDQRVSAIMLEINRRLYLRAGSEKNGRFAEIRRTLGELLPLLEGVLCSVATMP